MISADDSPPAPERRLAEAFVRAENIRGKTSRVLNVIHLPWFTEIW